MAQMNRPIVLKIIEKDIRLLLFKHERIKKVRQSTKKAKNHLIYQINSNKSINYYHVDNKTTKLAVLEMASKWGRKKVVGKIEGYRENYPKKIRLEHQHIPLALEFKLLNVKY